MDFAYSPAEEAFRADLRAWLDENTPVWNLDALTTPEADPKWEALLRAWQRKLHDGGWAGIHWPKEYGGRGASVVEQVIFSEELARARAPRQNAGVGLELVGPTLMAHGTEDQKQRYLPKILSGQEIWCQGFSEPNAGSDLAALQTRADSAGDEFIVNGSKIWTSGAHRADWCALLCRTDQSMPKHRGISFLLVNMTSPGIRVVPVRQMDRGRGFNQVFLQDVHVPLRNLVGEVNRGWYIAQNTLGFERGPITLSFYLTYKKTFADLLAQAQSPNGDGARAIGKPILRQRIAESYIDLEILRLNGYRALTGILRGESPEPEVSTGKVHWGLTDQRLHALAVDLLGPYGQLDNGDTRSIRNGQFIQAYLYSRAATIYGGTAQIQSNIIAERLLGMPR